MNRSRLRYLGYQIALVVPSAICAVAVAQTVPSGRPYVRLISVGVVVFIWLFASSRMKNWYFGARLRQRLRDGHFGEVAELYAPAFEHSQNAAARTRMALLMSVCELERDRPAAALEWLEKIDAGSLDDTSRGILLAQQARALVDDPPRALRLAEEAAKLAHGGPVEVAALTARGVAHLRSGHAPAAIADLERASTLAADGGEVPYLVAARARFLGDAYLLAGKADKARDAFARAAALPRHIPAAQAAAAALARAAAAGAGAAAAGDASSPEEAAT